MSIKPFLPTIAAAGLTLAACGDATGPVETVTITGTIENRTENPLPADARVLVVWTVSAGAPDHTFVFGEGTVDAQAGTFEIRLPAAPPLAALNGGQLGVGVVVVTSNQDVSVGDDFETVPPEEWLGATGQHAVIFVNDDPDTVAETYEWAGAFDRGYGAGEGEKNPGAFDRFRPVGSDDLVLIIDDVNNIEFVNWT